MNNDKKDVRSLMLSFKRYRWVVPLIMLATTSAFVAAAFSLPKSFKSKAVISIYTKYFQNPLVRDFVPETYDSSELRAQRESLIRLSLSDDFLDQLGEKYHFFKSERNTPQRSAERQDLVKRFEILGLNSSTYQIGFSAGAADVTYEVVKETLEQIVRTLMTERKKTVQNLREAMGERIESMALKLGKGSNPSVSVSQTGLRKELDNVNQQISALLKQYTERHPEVEKLKRRADRISRTLEKRSAGANGKELGDSALLDSLEASPEIYQDLVKKYGYLNILLETEKDGGSAYFAVVENPSYPTAAVFPKKTFFLMWGLLAGVALSFFVILIDTWRIAGIPTEPVQPANHPRRRKEDRQTPGEGSVWN